MNQLLLQSQRARDIVATIETRHGQARGWTVMPLFPPKIFIKKQLLGHGQQGDLRTVHTNQ